MRRLPRFCAVLCLFALAFAGVSGCTSVPAPEQFLEVDAPFGELRAVAADESLFRVRSFDDGERGDLAFWREALKHEFVLRRGYVLAGEREVQVRGRTGLELHFETAASGKPRGYLLTAWIARGVLANEIHVAEYVADKDVFDAHLPAVREVLGTGAPS